MIDFLQSTNLTIADLDEISLHLLKKPLIDLRKDDFPTLAAYCTFLKRRCPEVIRDRWEEMTFSIYGTKMYDLFPDLKFPYFLTDVSTFREIYSRFKEMLKCQM